MPSYCSGPAETAETQKQVLINLHIYYNIILDSRCLDSSLFAVKLHSFKNPSHQVPSLSTCLPEIDTYVGKLIRLLDQYIILHKRDSNMPRLAYLIIWLIWLLFSAGTIFFSHNNSARTVFFNQFQPSERGKTSCSSELLTTTMTIRASYKHCKIE